MAMQSGAAIQDKVARLLSRERGKPVLKPNKPLVLKNEVAKRNIKKGEATCITEVSLLMACWKQKDFDSSLCSSEVSAFYRCIEQAKKDKAKDLALNQGGRLPPKQVNLLLTRYPNITKEI
ncbi:small ribosomal subunit protein mS37 [Brachyhypopomus gauderio]|uniref:small ribosomal subunit protein mS37 n=1 Tax=Brachyhypopomus gauderio TaxID=698409 RepID=UPI0040431224